MFKDKAYVCNLCRKVITYSPAEAGKTFPCPFCKTTVTLPRKWARQPVSAPAGPKKRSGLVCFALALLAAGGVAGLSVKLASNAEWLSERVTVAPEPALVQDAQISVAVTDVWFGQVEMHNAALNTKELSQSPLCCVKLQIANAGSETVSFLSWREPGPSADLPRVTLSEPGGAPLSLASYGANCLPVGTRRQAELAPGATLSDTVLFLCAKKPAGDLSLTLPCENIGGRGQLCFRIPAGMIR